jgi:hypothetical protein
VLIHEPPGQSNARNLDYPIDAEYRFAFGLGDKREQSWRLMMGSIQASLQLLDGLVS